MLKFPHCLHLAAMPALEASTSVPGSEVEADDPGTSGRGSQRSMGARGSKVRGSRKVTPARMRTRTKVLPLCTHALAPVRSRLPVH